MRFRFVGGAFGLALACCATPALAQEEGAKVALAVASGRPLRIALNETTRVERIDQPVEGTLVDPVFAYDRIVLPSGAPVHGRIARLIDAPKSTRIRAGLNGDFSVPRQVAITFGAVDVDGRAIAIHTTVTSAAERVRREFAGGKDTPADAGLVARMKQAVSNQVHGAVADLKQKEQDTVEAMSGPGRLSRLKEALLNRLPLHPQYLHRGTVYTAELQAPIDFGEVVPIEAAPAGAIPAPDSILRARLATPLNSASASRGSAVTAVLTEPVFTSDHKLILAEGATLEGQVTFAAPARHWHRNGQVRFLFERVKPSADQQAAHLLASLYSVDVSANDRVTVDDEGGVSVTNSKTRFVAPALSVLALRGSIDQHHERLDSDGDPYDLGQGPPAVSNSVGARGMGGFFGFELLGIGLSQISRPVAIVFSSVGAVRTVYKNIVGKGDELSFQPNTPIQVRLAPGRTPDR